MKTIFHIFRRDLNRIFRNFVALLVVGGVCLIPAAYAWFNIYANMDPYANTAGINVAVCSLDKGTTGDLTGDLNVGDQIIDNIRQNDALGWEFTDEDDAIEGVNSGEYYAALVIPENFSADLISFLNGKLDQPEIDYYLNEKKNAIAPKVTDTGASTIQTTINETFIEVASESVANILNKSGLQLTDRVGDVQVSLSDTLQQVSDLLDQYETSLSGFKDTYREHKDAAKGTDDQLNALKDAASQGITALQSADQKLSDVRTAASDLSSMIRQNINDSSTKVAEAGSDTAAALGKVNAPVQAATGKLDGILASADTLLNTNAQILSEMQALNDEIAALTDSSELTDAQKAALSALGDQVSSQISSLSDINSRHQSTVSSLQTGNSGLSNASSGITGLGNGVSDFLENETPALQSAADTLDSTALTSVSNALDTYASVSGTLIGILGNVDPMIEQLRTLSSNLDTCLASTGEALDGTDAVFRQVSSDLDDLQGDVDLLTGSQSYQQFVSLSGLDSDRIASFMKSPVVMETETVYHVANYGSAMTPFYSNLAIWVSGIILVSVFKTEVDADDRIRKFSFAQAYIGRGLLFICVGLIQALIITLGDIYLLKAQCLDPAAFVFAGLLTSFVYINLIYGLASSFKHIGKALCVILVILQIPGGAGTYPIEMTPTFFQRLHPLLPFTYSIRAMRETIAGSYGNTYAESLGALLLFLPIALIIGLLLKPLLSMVNAMIDQKLRATGIMIVEGKSGAERKHSVDTLITVLMNEESTRVELIKKAEKFEDRYRLLIRIGFFLIVFLPIPLLVLLFIFRQKLILMTIWIISLIAIVVYLIVVEFLNYNVQHRKELLAQSDAELLGSLRNADDTEIPDSAQNTDDTEMPDSSENTDNTEMPDSVQNTDDTKSGKGGRHA